MPTLLAPVLLALTVTDAVDAALLSNVIETLPSTARAPMPSATFALLTVTVPAAVTVFPRDLQKLPRSWVEDRYRDLGLINLVEMYH